jgi:pimeloyl-ACP methyl ester carboxylesterase
MSSLLGRLVRIQTGDGLELHGLLYEPPHSTTKVVLHVHGWTGNFYENVFLDYIAKACIKQGYSFLSFNTRGAGFVQEFLKKWDGHVEYVKVGGSLEHFEDSVIDIRAAIEFLKTAGYCHFVLEGHSTGCQKAAHYISAQKDSAIKGLIFLEPADDPSIVKKFLDDRHREAMDYAAGLVADNKPDDPMPGWVPFGVQLSAQKFLSIADPNSIEGDILHVSGDFQVMKTMTCPLLVISASNSEYQDATTMQQKIGEVLSGATQHIIPDSGHWFFGHEEQLGSLVGDWLLQVSTD